MKKMKWIVDPHNKTIYNNGDLELKCPNCGYEWEYDEDTRPYEFEKCPCCNCEFENTWS